MAVRNNTFFIYFPLETPEKISGNHIKSNGNLIFFKLDAAREGLFVETSKFTSRARRSELLFYSQSWRGAIFVEKLLTSRKFANFARLRLNARQVNLQKFHNVIRVKKIRSLRRNCFDLLIKKKKNAYSCTKNHNSNEFV